MRIRAILAVAGLLAAGVAVATPAQAASAAPAAAGVKHVRFTVTFSSSGTTLHTLPGDITYGWNHLNGKTTWGKHKARVEFLGSVNYVDGNGPFGGYVTISRSHGTKLAFSVNGEAMSPPTVGTENTNFAGLITVIGGAGAYEGATGTGTMTGLRKAALGSPVTLTFDVRIRL